jgi:hypothetical protein
MDKEEIMAYTCDYICKKDNFYVADWPVDEVHPASKPICAVCSGMMEIFNYRNAPHMNLKTSTLDPGWEGFNIAFGKYIHSKEEAFDELKKTNEKRKELAEQNGYPFKPIEWCPESKEMDELETLRKQEGAEAVNEVCREYANDKLKKDADATVENFGNSPEFRDMVI